MEGLSSVELASSDMSIPMASLCYKNFSDAVVGSELTLRM